MGFRMKHRRMAKRTPTSFFDGLQTKAFQMNEPEIATREEVLALLTDQARKGSVTAAAALARELRAMDKKQENEVDAAIAREG